MVIAYKSHSFVSQGFKVGQCFFVLSYTMIQCRNPFACVGLQELVQFSDTVGQCCLVSVETHHIVMFLQQKKTSLPATDAGWWGSHVAMCFRQVLVQTILSLTGHETGNLVMRGTEFTVTHLPAVAT